MLYIHPNSFAVPILTSPCKKDRKIKRRGSLPFSAKASTWPRASPLSSPSKKKTRYNSITSLSVIYPHFTSENKALRLLHCSSVIITSRSIQFSRVVGIAASVFGAFQWPNYEVPNSQSEAEYNPNIPIQFISTTRDTLRSKILVTQKQPKRTLTTTDTPWDTRSLIKQEYLFPRRNSDRPLLTCLAAVYLELRFHSQSSSLFHNLPLVIHS